MNLERIETHIDGLVILQPRIFNDGRGYFYESWNKQTFLQCGIAQDFVQDNQSLSQQGVLRGLHFQKPPFAQAKLVRVIQGAVLDVAVDIRKNSPTYGQHVAVELTGENKTLFYIPEGFAHGFLTLQDDTIFAYKCSNYYHKASEESLMWNDPDLNIAWGIDAPLLSEKDLAGLPFRGYVTAFE